MFLVAASAPACGQIGEETPVDAAVPDAVQCSVAPAESPTPDPLGREIVYDRALGVDDATWRNNALFRAGDELLLFTGGNVHRITLDGMLVSSTPFAVPDATYVAVNDVVAGDGEYGAIVQIEGGPYLGFYLCVLDGAGALDIGRCASLPEGDVVPVLFDGASYVVYRIIFGMLRRTSYDPTATKVGAVDFPLTDTDSGTVRDAVFVDGVEHLLTWEYVTGSGCGRAREHVIEADGDHQVRDSLPADVGSTGREDLIAAGATGVTIVMNAGCMLEDCVGDPNSSRLLTTYEGGIPVVDDLPIPAPYYQPAAVLHDGDRIVVIDDIEVCEYETPSCYRCWSHAELSRFAPDGTTERFGVEVVNYEFDASAMGISAVVVGIGDYILLYRGVEGLAITRVRVP